MPRYSKLTNKLFPWLYQYIDRYSCGYWSTKENGPRPCLSKERLLRLKNGKDQSAWRQHKLTKTKGQKHLDGTSTLFFRSKDRSPYMLVNLDIDGKNGVTEEAAQNTAAYISRTLHKGVYYEYSTHGQGRHVYLLINKGKWDSRQWRNILDRYLVALRAVVAHKGIKTKIDRICGQPTLCSGASDHNGEFYWTIHDGDCGILAKIPQLPFGEDSLEWLMKSPMLTMKDLQKVIDRADRYKDRTRKSKKAKEAFPPEKMDAPIKKHINNMRTKLGEQSRKTVQSIRDEPDAFRRTHYACSLYVMLHKAFPSSALELREFYETNGFETGMSLSDRRRREKRCADVLLFQKTHRPEEMLGLCGYQPKGYLELVEQHVRPVHFEGIKCAKDRTITNEDLAACLYLMERNATTKNTQKRWQGTTGVDAIIKMFRVLKEAKVLPRGCNRNQASAMRRILVNSGLITLQDDHYEPRGKYHGVCKKYGVGENNPQHEQYMRFIDSIEAQQVVVAVMPVLEVSETAPQLKFSEEVLNFDELWGDEPIRIIEDDFL